MSTVSIFAVTSRMNETLKCISPQGHDTFTLTQERKQELSWTLHSVFIHQAIKGPFHCRPCDLQREVDIQMLWLIQEQPTCTLHTTTTRADPGSVINSGVPVTIWCQRTMESQLHTLHKEGNLEPWDRETPLKSRNKDRFSIPSLRYDGLALTKHGEEELSWTLDP
ncbi:hypothetical protein A6R68_19593, partial [Neotoma lepida]